MKKNHMIEILVDQPENPEHHSAVLKFGKFVKAPLILSLPTNREPKIKGQVKIHLKDGQQSIQGKIIIEIIGRIETLDQNRQPVSWIFLKKEQIIEAKISHEQNIFNFEQVLKPLNHSIQGSLFKVNYLIKVALYQNGTQLEQAEQDFKVLKADDLNGVQNYNGDFGVPETLHVKVEFNKTAYYLDDLLVGRVTINLTRVPLKSLELQLIKQESGGPNNSVLELLYKKTLKTGGIGKGISRPIFILLNYHR